LIRGRGSLQGEGTGAP